MAKAKEPLQHGNMSHSAFISDRKPQPKITVRYAEKAPKFVVDGKHTVVYAK